MAEIAPLQLITPSYFLFAIFNQLDGRKPSSWISNLTGLSQSRFRRGANQRFHRSTIEKIKQYQINVIKENNPDIDIEQFPSLATGKSCPFQDFSFTDQFPLLQSLSKEIDEFDQSLIQISGNPTAESIRHITHSIALFENPIYWLDDNTNDLRAKLNECSSHAEAVGIANKISINVFFSFLAAYDMEFCSIAFGDRLKLRPLFLDLIPKAHFEIPENSEILDIPKAKRFSLPTRRLLELTHGVFHYVKYNEWPISPASRKDFERFDETPGNYFDGTKKLPIKNLNHKQSNPDDVVGYIELTKALQKDLRIKTRVVFCPLAFAASFWEWLLVVKDNQYKLQQIILYDCTYYKNLWELHHQRWANQLFSGKEDWPTWLDD